MIRPLWVPNLPSPPTLKTEWILKTRFSRLRSKCYKLRSDHHCCKGNILFNVINSNDFEYFANIADCFLKYYSVAEPYDVKENGLIGLCTSIINGICECFAQGIQKVMWMYSLLLDTKGFDLVNYSELFTILFESRMNLQFYIDSTQT